MNKALTYKRKKDSTNNIIMGSTRQNPKFDWSTLKLKLNDLLSWPIDLVTLKTFASLHMVFDSVMFNFFPIACKTFLSLILIMKRWLGPN